ncbi:MAG: spermidine/putrescine transport system substrate-binding protein [Mycobacteriales bacterium]|jgi:spermidine/putrescine transport system substrate-binding protein
MPTPPVDPTIRDLINARLSRRSVLFGAAGAGLAAALAGCGTGPSSTSSGAGGSSAPAKLSPAADKSDTEKTVNWANWTLYLDYDDKTKKYPTLDAFSRQTGLAANYSEDIDDNDTYYGKIQAQLRNGQNIGQDVITLTDWMAARLIRNGWTQPFDAAAVPNAKNLLSALQNVDFDPGRKNSLTWQSGFGVLAWNKEKVPGGLHTVDDLWQPALKGRVEVLSEMRDTIGLIMLNQGVDVSGSFTADQFQSAVDVLDKQISSGQIRQVKGNSYKEDLISGDALAVIGWSGDIFQINAENGDKWGLTLPDAGGTLWSDNLMIPIGSPHKKNAEKLIDYYYDPKVAATVEAYVNYICPVQGAQAEMEKIDADLAKSPWIFPTTEFLAKAKVFRTLTPDDETAYNEAFQKVIGN